MNHSKTFVLVAVLALSGLLAGVFSAWALNRPVQPPQLQTGTALGEQARPLPPFSLIDDSGDAFDKSRLQDQWSFLFFGYTHCPDVCPMTLTTLDQTLRSIEAAGAETAGPQVVFVSVDPARDTPAQLRKYVNYFNPEFVGVTGEPAALEQLTSSLGILYAPAPNPEGKDNYLVDHSASILLINPAGELAAVFSAPHAPGTLAADFLKLRDSYRRS